MQDRVTTISPSRTYVVIIGDGNPKRFMLPEERFKANNDRVAASFYRRFLEKGQKILLCISYETLENLPGMDKIPLVEFDEDLNIVNKGVKKSGKPKIEKPTIEQPKVKVTTDWVEGIKEE